MKLEMYDQKKDKYSYNGCLVYGIGNIMLFNYRIYVTNNFLLKSLTKFEELGVRSKSTGAAFGVGYSTAVKLINYKLGINLGVETININNLNEDNDLARGLGIIKYHNMNTLVKDGILDKNDVEEFLKINSGVGHHIIWCKGYLINTLGETKKIKCSIDTLKYMAEKGMIWTTLRTIKPKDPKTKEILILCKYLYKAERMNTLDSFLDTNKYNHNLKKAKKLYFYGR